MKAGIPTFLLETTISKRGRFYMLCITEVNMMRRKPKNWSKEEWDDYQRLHSEVEKTRTGKGGVYGGLEEIDLNLNNFFYYTNKIDKRFRPYMYEGLGLAIRKNIEDEVAINYLSGKIDSYYKNDFLKGFEGELNLSILTKRNEKQQSAKFKIKCHSRKTCPRPDRRAGIQKQYFDFV